jgi:PAS domain S-box-containing protein
MSFEIEIQDFKKVFEYAPIGMGILDLKGKYLEINLALYKLLDYDNFQLIEMKAENIIYEEDLEQYKRYIELLENNKIENFEMDIRCKKKNGVIIWVQLSVNIVKRKNNFNYFIVTLQDITDKKEGQFDLLLKKMELEELNQNLEQFTYFVSHDLQEPLRNINKLISELKKHEQFKENEIIKSLDTYSKRMKSFISDLLRYSQAGKKLKLNYIDCNIVLDRVLENLNTLIKENKAIITFDYLPDVNFNALRLEQIFQNLISIMYPRK